MEITRAQFEQIEDCLPTQRGNVSLSNLQVLNAIVYVAEHGCKWRGLPKRFGNWHTIYTRMNRWAKSGVLDRAFAQLQLAQVVQIKSKPSINHALVQGAMSCEATCPCIATWTRRHDRAVRRVEKAVGCGTQE